MSVPTPLRSMIGGFCLSLPVHAMMVLNGNVFGISGMLHRAMRGEKESLFAIAGLISGGIISGTIESRALTPSLTGFPLLLLSGFLVGLGTKLANGCTSGHMIAGLSRFSQRSIAATATFFSVGAATARICHRSLPPSAAPQWNMTATERNLLAAQVLPLSISVLLYTYTSNTGHSDSPEVLTRHPRPFARLVAVLSTTIEFALGLQLSDLTEPVKVLSFLLLPFHLAFDPSLAFLAIGALPSSMFLYRYCRGPNTARLGGEWMIPKSGEINSKLLIGAVLFGVGWGMSGLCRPVLVNLGRALATGDNIKPFVAWLGTFVAGGLLV